MTSKIPISKVGKILSGSEVGSFVKVVDDRENTGGYLILTSASGEFKTGFNEWVDSPTALIKYFEESQWEIEWGML